MTEQLTALLSQAIATALKDALVPIVRDAVNEALKDNPQAPALPDNLEERLTAIESSLEDKVERSDIEEEVSSAVQDTLDNGSWDINFRS